ncbi:hypothetical protein V2J09_013802 [Rumex salicifolius]
MGRTVVSDDEDEIEPQDDERDPVDEEADEGEERGGDDEDDEEEEEGQDEYEKDGFIVDDLEEEEEVDEDGDRHKKKKRKKRESEKNFVLDEDDYELLEDNNITVRRPRPMQESQKFKRLKKAKRGDDAEHSGFSDEDEFGEKKIQRHLFDDGALEDIPEEEQREEEEEEDIDMGEEDEMADFIVDEDDVDETGVPKRKKVVQKKKFRSAPGVAPMAIQEAQEIFGDVEELLKLRQINLEQRGRYEESGEWRERKLEEEFEPIIVEEQYITEKDNVIRLNDVPERLQILAESTGPPSVDSDAILEEVKWIYDQLDSGSAPLLGQRISEGGDELILKSDIENFLKFTHIQKFDIPFIAMYRKDDCLSLFKELDQDESDHAKPTVKWHKVLWAIHELDKKWLLLQKRKSALEGYYHRVFEEECRRVDDETRLNFNNQIFNSIVIALKNAESEREVDDVDSKFNLHFPPGEVDLEEGQYKRPRRKSQYSDCSKAGLWMAACKFGYSSEQFGQQISLAKVENELEDSKETPEDMAANFVCARFETPEAVLKGARHMAAVEISCEPVVRKHFRSIYFENAVVSTIPTAVGKTVIDSFHEFAGVKWLREKPLDKFDDAQWLLIQKAEEEKLLEVKIKLKEDVLNKLISDCHEKYLSYGVSKSAQLWNEQRKLILHDAIYIHILASMEKEARSLLNSRAKNWLLSKYGKLLWDKVSVAPYQRKESDIHADEEAAPRIMACCWGPGKPATTFVMLDANGEIVDVLEAGSISFRSQNINDQQRKKNDQQRLLTFMAEHNPTVVILGAANMACSKLKEDIYEIVFKMVEENPRDVGHELAQMKIVYGDESLAHLYENSRVSSDQIPGHSGVVKRAVALGRYLQNPLAMVATLCGHAREILSWELSPLEKFLAADEKYMMIEQIMVDVANQVGLDLNLAANHEWLFAPLQFISGLGPRKAASLKRSLIRAGTIFTRKDLITNHGLGKKVFFNAAGFLRVRRSGLAASTSQFFDLLDDTRIHPESYGLAQEFAKEIYKKFFGDESLDDEDSLEMAVENLRERPNILKSFNLDAYADQGRASKRETLYAIRSELIQGFQDWRKAYEEPNQDEEFYMISGETEDTLAEGRTVQVTIRRVQAPRAICSLESGLTGMLTKEDFSDDRDLLDLTEKLREGDILTCKIKSIVKNRYQVFLTCKENDMRSNRHQNGRNMDQYYHEDRSAVLISDQEKAKKVKELAKKHFKGRRIFHPRFLNKPEDEAIKVIDRYVDPLVANLKSMLNYRKFRSGTKSEVDELLRAEKAENPMRIAYCLGIDHEHPGLFRLTYIRSSNPHHEYIALFPNGFKFRQRMFADIDRLINHFQKHINDPLDSPSMRAVAAMVPMNCSASGGGWGGSGGNEGRRGSSEGFRGGRGDRRGGGRGGRGRGSYNRDGGGDSDRHDSGYNNSRRGGSQTKDGDSSSGGGWGSFPGSKVENSPRREAAFPGGWGSTGGGADNNGGGNEGWGSASKSTSKGWGDDGGGCSSGGGGGCSPVVNRRVLRQTHAQFVVRLAHYPDELISIFNALLRFYSIGSNPEDALSLFKYVQLETEHFNFDSFTYSFVVKACANSRSPIMGAQAHARVAKVGFDSHVYVQTSLLNFYLVCGSLSEAHHLFDEMPERNVVSWNVMITGLIARREVEAAWILFSEMPRRNVVTWTGMIDGYTRVENYSKAFSLFQKMVKTEEIMPTGITLLTILPAVANLGDLRNCKSLHSYGNKSALHPGDIRLANCLIDAYSKCGCISSALKLFNDIYENKRNLVSWTSIISGFAMHGMAKEAEKSFQMMESAGLKPNQVTFLAILSACSHKGLIKEGLEFFRKMRDDYQLLPGIKHYGCVIDLLGRSGRLEEAEKLALEIRNDAQNVVIWRTLLGACSLHDNVDVCQRVTMKIQEMERGYGGDYVLMSNILTGNGKFGDAEKVRLMMDERNVFKVPGLSLA